MRAIQNLLKKYRNTKTRASSTINGRIVDVLLNEGIRIMEEAEASRDTNNVTGNQHDAYGCAVYYNGNKVKDAYLDEIATRPARLKGSYAKYRDGRKNIEDFLNSYDAESGNRYVLVVANAMIYSVWQEHGMVPTVNRTIRILSQISGLMDELSIRYKGKVRLDI